MHVYRSNALCDCLNKKSQFTIIRHWQSYPHTGTSEEVMAAQNAHICRSGRYRIKYLKYAIPHNTLALSGSLEALGILAWSSLTSSFCPGALRQRRMYRSAPPAEAK